MWYGGYLPLLTSLLDSLEDRLTGEASQQRMHVEPPQHLSLFWIPQVSMHEKHCIFCISLVGIMLIQYSVRNNNRNTIIEQKHM